MHSSRGNVDSTPLCREPAAGGQFLGANPLHPVAAATSVRVRESNRRVTGEPFAGTHEQLGGYFLVEAWELDEAIALAAWIPGARKGTIEIRAVLELAGLP